MARQAEPERLERGLVPARAIHDRQFLIMQYIWLIPLLPGIGAAINGLVGVRFFSRKVAGALA